MDGQVGSHGRRRATRRAAGTVLAVAAIAMLLSGAMCAGAWAGEYHVYSCRMPDGQVAPVDGWSETTSQAGDHTADTCATEGGLVAALDAGHSHPADTDLATWAFDAPAGETLAAATIWRAGDTAGGSNLNAEASYMFWFAGVANSGNGAHPFGICEALNGCAGQGNLKSPIAANNRLEVPSGALHSPYLSLNASCGSLIASSVCPNGSGDEAGNAAVVELFAADLVLTQESAPTVQEVKGPLDEATTVSGTTDVAFTATDSGSGVYEAVFQVDGQTVYTTVLSTNGGRCHDVGQTTDGLPAFLYTQPCPPSLSVDVPFDTTATTNGSHHIVVSVTDAAGNSTPVMDRQVQVSNHATPTGGEQPSGGEDAGGRSGAGVEQPSPEQPARGSGQPGAGATSSPAPGTTTAAAASPAAAARGAANGSEASDQATLTARWKGAAGARLKSSYGQPHTVEGRLTAPGGRPIVGAAIDVGALAAYTGARVAALSEVRTNAQGRFGLRLPRTLTSTTVSLSYRSHLGDALPVATRTLTLAVAVDLVLHISPRSTAVGHTIRFSGRLLGGAIPPGGKQLVLEGRSPGAPWTEFDVVRTDSHGAFYASHRFRLPGPVSYSFRVLSGYEADYPFLAGSSKVVGVLER
jgi:hypothetical protein